MCYIEFMLFFLDRTRIYQPENVVHHGNKQWRMHIQVHGAQAPIIFGDNTNILCKNI